MKDVTIPSIGLWLLSFNWVQTLRAPCSAYAIENLSLLKFFDIQMVGAYSRNSNEAILYQYEYETRTIRLVMAWNQGNFQKLRPYFSAYPELVPIQRLSLS